MDTLHAFTDEERSMLRDFFEEMKGRPANATQRGRYGPDAGHTAPDVYVALATNGIPALVEKNGTGSYDEPGWAFCDIYQLIDLETSGTSNPPNLQPIETQKRVFNLNTSAVPAGPHSWVMVKRTKDGYWYCISQGGAGPTPPPGCVSCNLAVIQEGDSLLLTSNLDNQVIELTWDGTAYWGNWTSGSANFVYPSKSIAYGSGQVVFWFANGIPHLSIGGKELLDCGNCCWVGGPLTGHASDPLGTGTHFVSCAGITFTVCITCTCPRCAHPCFNGNVAPCQWNFDATASGHSTGSVYYAGLCQWTGINQFDCSPGSASWFINVYWQIGYNSETNPPGSIAAGCQRPILIVLGSSGRITGPSWSLADPNGIDCTNPVTLGNFVAGTDCSNWPATVTITPISGSGDVPPFTPPCYEGHPCDWQFTIAGVTAPPAPVACVDCSEYNGTFTERTVGNVTDLSLGISVGTVQTDWWFQNFGSLTTIIITCSGGVVTINFSLNNGAFTDTGTFAGPLDAHTTYTLSGGTILTPLLA